MASKRPFKPIWGRVWEVLEGFGVFLGRFFPSLGRLLVVWGLSWAPLGDFPNRLASGVALPGVGEGAT